MYANLGLTTAMDREYPYYRGKNRQEEAEVIKDTSFTAGIALTIFLSIILIIIAIFLRSKYPTVVIVGVFVISVVSILQQVTAYYKELFRIEKKVKKVNLAILIFSLINCILSILLVIKFNLYGLYAALIAAYIFTLVYIINSTKHHFAFKIDLRELRRLMALGVSILLINITAIILMTLDQIFIIKFLGPVSLGYYSLSALITGFILYLPIALQFVSYPHLIENYAKTDSPKDSLLKFVVRPTLILVYPVAAVISLALLSIGPVIKYILPKFIVGVTAIRILTIGTFFLALVYLPGNFLVALNRQYSVVKIQILCIIINITALTLVILKGGGINQIALVTVATYFIMGSLILGYPVWIYLKDFLSLGKFFLKVYFPLFYFLGIFFLSSYFIKAKGEIFIDHFLALLTKLFIFIIANAPFLYYWKKKKILL
jgi:PST family polysaccharide transporter